MIPLANLFRWDCCFGDGRPRAWRLPEKEKLNTSAIRCAPTSWNTFHGHRIETFSECDFIKPARSYHKIDIIELY